MKQNFATTIEMLHDNMTSCEQTPGMNMLQHGQMVHAHYLDLISQLENGTHECTELKLIWEHIKHSLPSTDILKRYQTYHDCAKPLCLEIGDDGKRRFPNHAELSAKQYHRIFPEDELISDLIRHDMDFHIMRGDDLLRLWKSPLAPALYLTAWAEISANAEMFGGKQSESYKIKRSRLIQAGKKYLSNLKKE